MTHRKLFLILAAATACGALALSVARARDVPEVATGFVANVICSETFVSGLDPKRNLAETTDAMPGAGPITWAMDTKVDRQRKDVTVTLFGFGRSHAVYREGVGCTLEHGEALADGRLSPLKPQAALLPEIAGPGLVAPQSPQLAAALDRAFAEPAEAPFRHTRAVVVMKDDRIVAERYADGIGTDTPLLGFSATKSVISALIGILVREGRLTRDQPVPIAAWQNPDDPRHAITVDELLRHTAGLALGSSLQASLASVLEPVNRMKFMESDMAAFAERAPLESAPGRVWNYHDGNYLILSHLIRNAAGGRAADVMRFAREELFGPLGMRNVVMQFDAAGTPEGSGAMMASARDWARFGQLYLDDGVAGGKRILPEGWVRYSASPTPHAWVGIGAGFWTNLGDSFGAHYRVEHGWPRDAFFAKGTIGQYVIIVPSQRLVIVRLGRSPNMPPEADGVFDLVRDVVTATSASARLAGGN
ncbi:CubicO group peptidase (beta-lactamase class C family) [Bradyrhizobium japonicum]|uniref:CubicO group peptidase (Beta-lactamase class C family) n=1 Tax=Bradyrhizobium elkanii TaxID=29448 RepID=A0ABV4FEU2_BRAEL|nr:serine hydrolase [Bradyrhizobium elkanii]MBP2430886.1 CubicO group peptidase (beta-lactamase class C family) [Bradyrhizobium elkanii]MCP1735767.1 CubicO group peptidase (beta-lactamase class C family) [Bradyrhizobium elkanii]MCP1753569.1 CubicO group peptidase (beta-lactamase class C family) [Bradyrhizobium elkanii]MCP1979089.1 CubicO group peptidase (beta-lactamase class C family) [Bradyrhizobium elkanii]MCS3571108.1 CubicO group peptidase (beta-lactamase class C family) [Bradyrhizobium el